MNKIKYWFKCAHWLITTVALLPLAILLASLGSLLHYLVEKVDLFFEQLVYWKGKVAPFPLTDKQKDRAEWFADEDL